MKSKQRVSEKDAEIILNKLIGGFKDKYNTAITFVEDYAGGSQSYINEDIVKELIKKLTR